MKTSKKTGAWFVPVRGSYLPASSAGWLTYVPFIGYLIFVYMVSIEYTENALVAVLLIVPNFIAATAVMNYIARKKS